MGISIGGVRLSKLSFTWFLFFLLSVLILTAKPNLQVKAEEYEVEQVEIEQVAEEDEEGAAFDEEDTEPLEVPAARSDPADDSQSVQHDQLNVGDEAAVPVAETPSSNPEPDSAPSQEAEDSRSDGKSAAQATLDGISEGLEGIASETSRLKSKLAGHTSRAAERMRETREWVRRKMDSIRDRRGRNSPHQEL
mmetsp:Transcript_13963/g.32974  ORF Transcript_13963/g.32974 Transcript_13963/m.32974 type:complete len:193 (-) Transcript_13963:150-728(-)